MSAGMLCLGHSWGMEKPRGFCWKLEGHLGHGPNSGPTSGHRYSHEQGLQPWALGRGQVSAVALGAVLHGSRMYMVVEFYYMVVECWAKGLRGQVHILDLTWTCDLTADELPHLWNADDKSNTGLVGGWEGGRDQAHGVIDVRLNLRVSVRPS